jgi:hypothetical protein
MGVNVTGSGSCPVVGFGVEPSGSTPRELDYFVQIYYKGHSKSTWTGGSAVLLCRRRRRRRRR